MKEHAHFGLWIRPNLANVDNKISLSIQGKFDRRIFILTRSIDYLCIWHLLRIYIYGYHAKKVMGPQFYQVRAIQVSLFRFACIEFYRYLFVISSLFCEMFSFSLSGRHIRLIAACCYFVWEPRVNNVISSANIDTILHPLDLWQNMSNCNIIYTTRW